MNWGNAAGLIAVLGKITGYLALAASIFVYVSTKRDRILKVKFSADVLWALNYFFIGAYTPSALNCIAMLRETVFFYRTKKKWAAHRLWLLFFIAVTVISGLLTWNGWICLLPMVGSIFIVISFYLENPLYTKWIGVFANGMWLVYVSLIGNVPAIIGNCFFVASAIIGLFNHYRPKKTA